MSTVAWIVPMLEEASLLPWMLAAKVFTKSVHVTPKLIAAEAAKQTYLAVVPEGQVTFMVVEGLVRHLARG